jgi:hypothetical protein
MKALLFSLLAVAACSSSSNKTVYVNEVPDGGGTESPDAGGSTGSQCTSARKTTLDPISSVSTGEVKVISNAGGVMKIYVDASAGGTPNAAKSPRVYLKLSDGSKAAIDDNAAFTSSDWDIAFKRVEIWTNSGDTGPGKGGGVLLTKAFDAVTAADAAGVRPESLFNADCSASVDEVGDPTSTFDNWYDYDESTHIPSPKANTTFVMKGADGTSTYAVELLSYSGKDDGSLTGGQTAQYVIQVKKL